MFQKVKNIILPYEEGSVCLDDCASVMHWVTGAPSEYLTQKSFIDRIF